MNNREAYLKGVKDTLNAFGSWKDGTQVIGCLEIPIKEAYKQVVDGKSELFNIPPDESPELHINLSRMNTGYYHRLAMEDKRHSIAFFDKRYKYFTFNGDTKPVHPISAMKGCVCIGPLVPTEEELRLAEFLWENNKRPKLEPVEEKKDDS